MALLELTIYPVDKGQSLSQYVARCLHVIDSSGLDYQCHAMGTNIEGSIDDLLAVAKRCFDALADDCERIEIIMRLDYRRGSSGRLHSKVESLEQKLGRTVKK